MPEWEYLTKLPFQFRYAIAALVLDERDCMKIVEIGGYKTPITQFLPRDNYEKVLVYDPQFESVVGHQYEWGGQAWWINKHFQDDMDNMPESDFGLVCLGMEVKGDIQPLFDLVNRSRVTIIGFPDDWEPTHTQFEQVLANTTKKVTMQCQLDLSGNDLGDIKGYPPRYVRNMFVLE